MLLALRDQPTASGGVSCGTLLAVDLRNGKVIAQLREIAELYQDVPCSFHQLIPLRTGAHALLVTQPDLGLPSLRR